MFPRFCVLLSLTAVVGIAPAQPVANKPSELQLLVQKYNAAQQAGRHADAMQGLRETSAALAVADPTDPTFPMTAQQVAQGYFFRGFTLEAEKLLQSLLARVAALGESHPNFIRLANAQAQHYTMEQQTRKAIVSYEKLLPLLDKYEAEPWMKETVLSQLARLYEMTGKLSEAEALLQRQAELSKQARQSPPAASARATRMSFPAGAATSGTSAVFLLSGVNQVAIAHSPFYGPIGYAGRYMGPGNGYAQFLTRQGRNKEAEEILRADVEKAGAAASEPLSVQMMPLQALASFLTQQKRWDEAMALQQQIYNRYKQSTSPNDQQAASGQLQMMANVAQQAGRGEQAEQYLRQAVESSTSVDANGVPGTRFAALSNYAQYLLQNKRLEDAAKAIENLSAMAAGGSQQQPWMRSSVDGLRANLLEFRGDPQGAARLREQMSRAQTPPGTQPQQQVMQHLNAARAAVEAGKTEEAYAQAQEAIAISPESRDFQILAHQIPMIAGMLLQRGKAEEAENLGQLGMAAMEHQKEWDVQSLPQFQLAWSDVLTQKQRWVEAGRLVAAARESFMTYGGEDTAKLRQVYEREIQMAEGQQNYPVALETIAKLLAYEERVNGPISQFMISALQRQAGVQRAMGMQSEALTTLQRVLQMSEKSPGQNAHMLVNILQQLASIEQRTGAKAEAIAHLERAIALMESQSPNSGMYLQHQLAMIKNEGRLPPAAPGRAPNALGNRWFNTPAVRQPAAAPPVAPPPAEKPKPQQF